MTDIYREELLDLYRNPINQGSMSDPTAEAQKNNPLCGDSITVQLKIENDKIQDIKFSGQSCAVTVISASLLSEHLVGKNIREAKNFTKRDLLELIGVNLTTSRIKCATLFLDAVHEAL